MNFHVGQKVVCVERCGNTYGGMYRGRIPIAVGQILTIRDIANVLRRDWKVSSGIRFIEIINPKIETLYGDWEYEYLPSCFRPVVERKTDISIFEAMLTKTEERV